VRAIRLSTTTSSGSKFVVECGDPDGPKEVAIDLEIKVAERPSMDDADRSLAKSAPVGSFRKAK
jgi:hypothetical protein